MFCSTVRAWFTVALLLSVLCTWSPVHGNDGATKSLVLVVVSQDVTHHVTLAEELRDDVRAQAYELGLDAPVVHLTHEEFPDHGAWTFLPTISWLSELHGTNSSWIFFSEDRTRIRLAPLLELLGQFDPTQDVWVGHGLHDFEPTITHHFKDEPDFYYPLLHLGFAISTSLINSLALRLKQRGPQTDFSIDSAYELSRFVSDSGQGSTLTHSPLFCLADHSNCASYYVPFEPCGKPVPKSLIHFAVKTCEKFHKERLPVIQETWAKTVRNIAFYSDHRDASIPTVDLGVPNTERGHCGKTVAILKHVSSMSNVDWLVIADDDTLLSVSKIQDLLSCYSSSKPIGIGERYGYNTGHRLGYNYITGGGGIVLNMVAVRMLAEGCRCPTDTTPDDMYLGICMVRLGIPVVHNARFHQARPPDYAPEVLSIETPISFHKHWMIEPIAVYSEWFADRSQSVDHTEL